MLMKPPCWILLRPVLSHYRRSRSTPTFSSADDEPATAPLQQTAPNFLVLCLKA